MATEKKLIEADVIKSCLCKCCNILHSEEPCEPSECNVVAFIEEQPAVDAVEVVRCKDCKHRTESRNNGEYMCGNPFYGMASNVELLEDDFCSYGERKEKDANN